MKRFNSFQSINVFELVTSKWPYETHKHNFYELIFVVCGCGKHLVNGLKYTYKDRDIFLLTPNDAHSFEIESKTTFIYLKFTEAIFLEKLSSNRKTFWEASLKNILEHYKVQEGCFVKNKQDKAHLFSLIGILLTEFNTKNVLFNTEVVLELFGAIMALVTRNLNHHKTEKCCIDKDSERVNSILSYIRLNAIENDKMQIRNIAAHFNLSPNYISIFVKKHTGLPIQQHIIQAKLKTAERLLKQKRLNINEIALRLGFNDASHFNKLFKKYKGTAPLKFRFDGN